MKCKKTSGFPTFKDRQSAFGALSFTCLGIGNSQKNGVKILLKNLIVK